VNIKESVQELFQEVFEDPSLEIIDGMTAHDVERWDSLEHINLIIATENRFKIKFTTAEMSRLKGSDQNVGSFIKLIESKLGAAG
jgi:acyl carrier protein